MRYFCLANPIPLLKTTPSDYCLDNFPLFGTTMYGKLPVTTEKIREVFHQSETLIVCKTLDDALIMRQTKLDKKTNTRPDFFNKIHNLPSFDYAIYEVDIDSQLKLNFTSMNNVSKTLLASLVSYDLYFKSIYEPDSIELPCVEICYDKKVQFNPRLIRTHYFPLDGVTENETMSCNLF